MNKYLNVTIISCSSSVYCHESIVNSFPTFAVHGFVGTEVAVNEGESAQISIQNGVKGSPSVQRLRFTVASFSGSAG